jgi:hypothetical protein
MQQMVRISALFPSFSTRKIMAFFNKFSKVRL